MNGAAEGLRAAMEQRVFNRPRGHGVSSETGRMDETVVGV